MSAPNFKTMSDFPLIVAEPQYRKVCPECGLSHSDDAETCEECGTDLSSVEAEYDDLAAAARAQGLSLAEARRMAGGTAPT